jgi:hypothetical protein
MRVVLRSLAILVVVLAMVPMAQAGVAAAQPELVTTGDELVVINNIGRLVAIDPYTPPGFVPVAWESPETGFTNVVTGDFDGDGSAEVVGLRGGEAVIYDPVRRPGEPDSARVFTATPGQVWRQVVTGDLDADGSDELVLVESSSATGLAIRMYGFKFTASGGWNQIFSAGYGANWVGLSTGDVTGDGRAEVIGIRNPNPYQIIIFSYNAAATTPWNAIFQGNYSFPWVAVAVGNVSNDSANRAEIVTSRSGVLGELDSVLVFRWTAPSSLQDVTGARFFPEFRHIALADVNGSGDDEIFLLRSGLSGTTAIVALTNINIGSDPAATFNELSGQNKWNGIRAGDVDGDGKDEVIVMSSNEYLIYMQPDVNTLATSFPGAYSTTGNFAVGNLDGPGVSAGPTLAVSPLTLDLNLQAGQNASQPVSITNVGVGALSWTATVVDGAAWLSMSATAGTAPSTPQLLVSTGGVAPGQYVGRVRIDAAAGTANSPQTITVNLTVTAPAFSVQPNWVSWFYQPPINPGVRTVTVSGQNVAWHAGLVPMSVAAQVEQAVAAGQPVRLHDGQLIIGEGGNAEGTPVVDWIDVNPVMGVATPGGILVDLTLVLDRVPYGVNSAAVVFVADNFASPPAVVVRANVLRSLPNGADLYFLPLIVHGH